MLLVISVYICIYFCFPSDFGFDCQRGEIIEWVNQGGGLVIDARLKQKVHFTIECHGVLPRSVDITQTTYVSSHWIRSCLEVYMHFLIQYYLFCS